MPHATNNDKDAIVALEREISENLATSEDVLSLALMYIEPAHNEQRAATLLQSLLKTSDHREIAAIWLGYLALHVFMDADSLQQSMHLLREVATGQNRQCRAAAHLLLGQIIRELSRDTSPINEYRASIAEAPDWVANHLVLAEELGKLGAINEAADALRVAIGNIVDSDPAWPLPVREFEQSISARTAYRMRERLLGRIQDLQSESDARG